jgi:hypothetical protein
MFTSKPTSSPASNRVFYFGVLHPVARTLSRLLLEPSLATTQGVYFIYFCRYVSALAGHLQEKYTIILFI